jgi:uncharacterized protein
VSGTALPGFDPDAVSAIRERLDMARQTGVILLFAIESGSRAWGFPSPDSDYDCRFVYLRPAAQHLVLQVQRDVIEFPIEGDIDAGGWDLRKALLLALKGNAVIHEWVDSPLVYEEMPGFRDRLRSVLADIAYPEQIARHYAGLLRVHFPGGDGQTKLKKLFYAIRPALSLQFLHERSYKQLPPMDIDNLLANVDITQGLRDEIAQLLILKKSTREMGMGLVPGAIAAFLDIMNDRYRTLPRRFGVIDAGEAERRRTVAEDFYKWSIESFG